MSKRSEARTQFLADILSTALEGGIGYWSKCDNIVRDGIGSARGWYYKSVDLYDIEEHDDKCIDPWTGEYDYDNIPVLHVNLDTIARGIRRATTKGSRIRWSSDFEVANRTDGEDGDYDASDADMIVQLGLFGEVRYG